MDKYEYQIVKHTRIEWVVTGRKEGSKIMEPIAKCNTQAIALTIKGLYEESDRKVEEKAND